MEKWNFKNRKIILEIGIFVYLLLPRYYYIGGLNLYYISAIIFMFVCIIESKRIKLIYVIKHNTFFWIYFLYLFVINFIYKGCGFALANAIATIGIAYILIAEIQNFKIFYKIIDVIILVIFVCCIFGIFEALTSVNIFQMINAKGIEFPIGYRMGHIRIMGQLNHPIVYGYFLILGSALIVFRLSTRLSKFHKCFIKYTYILVCINILLTCSRAPIATFILLQLILLFKSGYKKFVMYITILFVTVILIYSFSVIFETKLSEYVAKFISMFTAILGENSSEAYSGVGDRHLLFSWVTESIGNDIWFGKGINSVFNHEIYEWQIKSSIENEYLNIFYSQGLVGVIFCLLSFIGTIAYLFKNIKAENHCKIKKSKIGFNFTIMVTLFLFYIVIFSACQSYALNMHIVIISLVITYNKLQKLSGNFK